MRILFYSLFLAVLFLQSEESFAGKLSDLEKSATKSSESRNRSGSSSGSGSGSSSSGGGYSIGDQLFGYIIEGMVRITVRLVSWSVSYGGTASLRRFECESSEDQCSVTGDEDDKTYFYRKSGDTVLPMLKLNVSALSSGDISGYTGYAEAGYGPAAISYELHNLVEDGNHLAISNTLLHYRMTFGNRFSVGLAAGTARLEGNDHNSGTAFGFPVRLSFDNGKYTFEYYPVSYAFEGSALNVDQFTFSRNYDNVSALIGLKRYSTSEVEFSGVVGGIQFNF